MAIASTGRSPTEKFHLNPTVKAESWGLLSALLAFASCQQETVAPKYTISAETRERLQLDDFYQKRVEVEGFSIVASENVSDHALEEAAFIIRKMVGHRTDLLTAMDASKTRLAIMGRGEFTTDLPEHAHLRPALYWNRRARGLGADPDSPTPCVSCGEENLIGLEGDPYSTENILIHEFAHALHQMGIAKLDPGFQEALEKTYENAISKGLWRGTYAATNPAEYWAEGVQSWFGTNREDDHDHNHVNTRKELKEYDSDLADLIKGVFGNREWTYLKPQDRKPPSPHMKGLNLAKEKPFRWPDKVLDWYDRFERGLVSLAPEGTPEIPPITEDSNITRHSIESSRKTTFYLRNLSSRPIRVDWIDFEGKPIRYAELRHKDQRQFSSFSSHLWQIADPETNSTLARYLLPDANASQVNLRKENLP